MPRLSRASRAELVERLGDPNLCVRTLATNELFDRFGAKAIEPLRSLLTARSSAEQRVGALWVLGRLGALRADDIARLSADGSRTVRVHLARCLAEQMDWSPEMRTCLSALLRDEDPFVRRAAADAFGQHPEAANSQALLRVLPPQDSLDTHLRHTVRIALRNRLAGSFDLDELHPAAITALEQQELASICRGVASDASARFLADVLRVSNLPTDEVSLCVSHIGRHGSPATIDMAARSLREQSQSDLTRQFQLIEALQLGLPPQQREAGGPLKEWATDVARDLLQRVRDEQRRWSQLPLADANGLQLAWAIQRQPREGRAEGLFFGGRPDGELGVGILRSEPFPLPATLTFWLAGHDGFPDRPAVGKNRVLLRDVQTGRILAETSAPRQDAAVQVEWRIPDRVDQEVLLEVVDGLSASAYAWIAVGEFSLKSLNPVVDVPAPMAAQLISAFHIRELDEELARLATDESISLPDRAEVWRAQLALSPDAQLSSVLPLALDMTIDPSLRTAISQQLASRDTAASGDLLKRSLQVATESRQRQIADTLCGSSVGAERLMELVRSGAASARLLTVPTIRQKLEAIDEGRWLEPIAELTAAIPPANQRLAQLIASRRQQMDLSAGSTTRGKALFSKNCEACHQVGGVGKQIGPQLDGVAIRGVDRLLEDLLDPNRNVDMAFRTITVLMDDGRVVTGLQRREEPGVLVLADSKGEEVRLDQERIEARQPSAVSLMPENLVETLSATELSDLLSFLLSPAPVPGSSPSSE